MNTQALDPKRWQALAVVGAAFFMTVLDVTIVNIALPTIGTELDFPRESLQWMISAYAITFGGFLLLGGRLADLLGRRTVFMVGVGVFSAASLACGLAGSESVLITARAVQGIGAAIVAPAALSIVSTAFTEGSERNKALGVWGALAGCGGVVGMISGGLLTKYAGWEWVFFVNVPVGAAVLILTVPIVRNSRTVVTRRRYDPLGAVTVTASLMLLVYALSTAPAAGWTSARTIGLVVGAVALLGVFVATESRVEEPLLPLSLLRNRTVSGANIVGLLVGGTLIAMFFLLTLYVQQVLHYSALKTGMTFLTLGVISIVAAGLAQALVTRLGPKIVMAIGTLLMLGANIWLTFIPVDGSYVSDLLPAYIATGLGIGFVFVPISIAALTGVEERQSGVASGLINTSEQIGAAIAVAVASSVFTSRANSLLGSGHSPADALTHGFRLGFWILVVFTICSFVGVMTLLRSEHLEAAGSEDQQRAAPTCFSMNRAATSALTTAILGRDSPAAKQPGTPAD